VEVAGVVPNSGVDVDGGANVVGAAVVADGNENGVAAAALVGSLEVGNEKLEAGVVEGVADGVEEKENAVGAVVEGVPKPLVVAVGVAEVPKPLVVVVGVVAVPNPKPK
jgi:hypothetical protein